MLFVALALQNSSGADAKKAAGSPASGRTAAFRIKPQPIHSFDALREDAPFPERLWKEAGYRSRRRMCQTPFGKVAST
jgi:hypothetical protein